MPEPQHDEALVNNFLERVSALSVSAFDGADVTQELTQLMRDASTKLGGGGNIAVLKGRLHRSCRGGGARRPAAGTRYVREGGVAGARVGVRR